jgi:NADH dehydrogenase
MILIAGSTGTLGGMITRRLLAQGQSVRILVRPGSNFQPLVELGAHPAFGDLKDRASLDAACQGVDTVITTANSALRGEPDTPETVEWKGNCGLIDAAKAAQTVQQFIFISMSGADVNSPAPFVAGKARAEEHLKESGLPYTIIAPGAFAEIWIGMVVAAPVMQGLPVMVYSHAKTAFISIADVASFTLAVIGHPKAVNQRLEISGPEALSFAEAAQVFGKLLHCPVPVNMVRMGEPVPTVPPAVAPLMIGLSMSDWSVPMEGLANTFGVAMTPFETVAQRMIQPQ